MKSHKDLTKGPIHSTLIKQTIPMIGGMFAMTAFNMIDTIFVSLINADTVAAMGFTFPVVMLVTNIGLSLGLGITTTISLAIGHKDFNKVKKLTTNGLLFGVITSIIVGAFFILFGTSIYKAMGAEGEVLKLTEEYMLIWLLGAGAVFIPMIANHALRGLGEMTVPSIVLILGTVLNAILDPILIFGWGSIPPMGMAGAALATVLSRLLLGLPVLYLLYKKYHIFQFKFYGFSSLYASVKEIMFIAVPVILTNCLRPVTSFYITSLVAIYGTSAVAAYAIGDRIMMLIIMVPIALGVALPPFVGQNFGAKLYRRIEQAWQFACRFGAIYGVLSTIVVLYWGRWLASLFRPEVEIQAIASSFLIIIMIASVSIHATVHTTFVFTAMKKPYTSAVLDFIRQLVLSIPLCYLGNEIAGIEGIFWGLALANILVFFLAIAAMRRFLAKKMLETHVK